MSTLPSMRVLVVEDEPMIAMDIEGTIEDEGHVPVGWAQTSDEAIALYEATYPDVVFLDVQLADGTSGIDVAADFQRRGGVKFVFMTSNANVVASDLLGGVGIVQKPFTQAQLVEIIRFLHQGLVDPPPSMSKPSGLKLGPAYAGNWA